LSTKLKAKRRTLAIITSEIHAALKRETADVLALGKLLTEVKSRVRGRFQAWLKDEFSLSIRTAQDYMAAHRLSEKYATVADWDRVNLGRRALNLLSSAGSNEREQDVFTPAAIEAILHEAQQRPVGEERCWEIAHSLRPRAETAEEWREKAAKAHQAEIEAEREAEEILAGPPPELPPGTETEAPPPTPRDEALIASFRDAIETLKGLSTKPTAKFAEAVAPDELETVIDFLKMMTNADKEPSDAQQA
jgi:hypothetical protein